MSAAADVKCVAFNPQGSLMAIGSRKTNKVSLWHIYTDVPPVLKEDLTFDNEISTVAFHPTLPILACGAHITVFLYEINDRQSEILGQLNSDQGIVTSLAFSSDGRFIASGHLSNNIQVLELLYDDRRKYSSLVLKYNVENQGAEPRPRFSSSAVRTVAFHPKKPILASGSDDGTIILWSVNEGNMRPVWSMGPPVRNNHVSSLAFHSTGLFLAGGCRDMLYLWKMEDDRGELNIKMLEKVTPHPGGLVSGVAFHPTSFIIATCSPNRSSKLWCFKDKLTILKEITHENPVNSVAFNPRYPILASTCVDTGSNATLTNFGSDIISCNIEAYIFNKELGSAAAAARTSKTDSNGGTKRNKKRKMKKQTRRKSVKKHHYRRRK
jgi:WD40 repeat protein